MSLQEKIDEANEEQPLSYSGLTNKEIYKIKRLYADLRRYAYFLNLKMDLTQSFRYPDVYWLIFFQDGEILSKRRGELEDLFVEALDRIREIHF